jgi:transposase
MLGDPAPFRPTPFDLEVFESYVPPDHHLRKCLQVLDWDAFHEILAPFYADIGRPSEPPVLMLKLEYLRYQYNLSDRQVIERAETDLAFRLFLQVDVYDTLVHPTSLCCFRGRLGIAGFRQVFRQIVSQARKHGLVKDRLRLKDATHVIANIAVPSTLALVAQVRDQLLAAAEVFDPVRVEGERVNVQLLRERTGEQKNEQRLVARVTHLREILAWVDLLTSPEDGSNDGAWQTLLECRQLAHKILRDQEHPDAGDHTRSTVDPDVRRGKHGQWYDGYLLDISMDADSELITEINVLPANGAEAADAVQLIQQEEATHGNDIEQLSIDGIGFNGPVLRELEDPEGLAVDTYVPPPKEAETDIFTPEDFVEAPEQGRVICPAGETSSYRQRDSRNRSSVHRFKRVTCDDCELLSLCMSHPPQGTFGKTVRKNDYQAEYDRARQKATTAEYDEVRSEHPKVERKLGEVTNRHGGRRARYWGDGKVLIQELMSCTATNVKRVVRLICAPTSRLAREC